MIYRYHKLLKNPTKCVSIAKGLESKRCKKKCKGNKGNDMYVKKTDQNWVMLLQIKECKYLYKLRYSLLHSLLTASMFEEVTIFKIVR